MVHYDNPANKAARLSGLPLFTLRLDGFIQCRGLRWRQSLLAEVLGKDMARLDGKRWFLAFKTLSVELINLA